MKSKLLYLLFAVSLILSSCGKIEDLESRLDKVENLIGSDEPMSIKFSTKDYADADVVRNTAFYFKSSDSETSYMSDDGDGYYYIYIERFSDVEWQDGAWMSFSYNPTTKDVISYGAGTYFNHSNGNYIDANFYYWTDLNEVIYTIKSFDPSTGKISVTAKATSTTDYGYNEYEGKAMSCDFSFNGKVTLFVEND